MKSITPSPLGGFFIEAGSNDAESDSDSLHFELNRGWTVSSKGTISKEIVKRIVSPETSVSYLTGNFLFPLSQRYKAECTSSLPLKSGV